MKTKLILLITICLACLWSCSEPKIIELPLTKEKGYGPFHSSFGGLSTYSSNAEEPWKSMQLQTQGVPKDWENVKYGDIETNIYQSVYQNYQQGKVTEESYAEMKTAWDWKPDSGEYSKKPIKTKIAYAFTQDSSGNVQLIVDANNNLDFSDDRVFEPLELPIAEELNKDSVLLSQTISVDFEQFVNGQMESRSTPISIVYLKKYGMFMSNFPNYYETEHEGARIGICSDNFTNLLYRNPSIAVLSDSLNKGDKLDNDALIEMNEYMEVGGQLYQNLGVNKADNVLKLKRIEKAKSELHSTQTGFRAFPFEGKLFQSDSTLALNNLQGKYVLLDFWATWCKPCLQEIPNLKELYDKTDRSEFEIVSVVGESSVESLQKIIKKDSIAWPQIVANDSNQINNTYGIQGYPTTFLLDPKGMIVAKDIRGDELEEKVMGLVKE